MDGSTNTTDIHPGHKLKGRTNNMKTYIEKAALVAKNAKPGVAGRLRRKTHRSDRHEAQRMLTTGGWEEDDRYQGQTPPSAFQSDLVGVERPQNPGVFGTQIGGLL